MLTNSKSLSDSFKKLYPQTKFTSAELKAILRYFANTDRYTADASDIMDIEAGWFVHTEDEILKEFKINAKINIKKRFNAINCPYIHVPSEKVYLLFGW